MQQPRAGDAARASAAGATAAGAPPSGAPAASGCAAFAGGVVRPPAVLRVRAVVPHTGAQGRRRPATCVCAFRPLRMRTHAVFLRVIVCCYTRCVRWPGRTRSRCACECAVVRPGPSRMALPVRVPAAELRACRAPAACRAMCFDGWCPHRRPPGRILPPLRGLALQPGWALALAGRIEENTPTDREPVCERGRGPERVGGEYGVFKRKHRVSLSPSLSLALSHSHSLSLPLSLSLSPPPSLPPSLSLSLSRALSSLSSLSRE